MLREKAVRYGFTVLSKDSGELLAEGVLVVVAADKKTGRATQLPRVVAEKLEPFSK
jgi:acyl-CoA thioesterase FadM